MSVIRRLTKSIVEDIPFLERGQKFYVDGELKGFGLRVGKTNKAYYAEKRVDGKTVRVTIGTHGQITTEQARNKAQELLGKMTMGENPNKHTQIIELTEEERQVLLESINVKMYDHRKTLEQYEAKILNSIYRKIMPSGKDHFGYSPTKFKKQSSDNC